MKSLCFDGGSPQRSGPVLSALFFFFSHEIQYKNTGTGSDVTLRAVPVFLIAL